MQRKVCTAFVQMADLRLKLERELMACVPSGAVAASPAEALVAAEELACRRRADIEGCTYPSCTDRCSLFKR